MSITLDLPSNLEAILRQRAEQSGQEVSQIALAILTLGLSINDEARSIEAQQEFLASLQGIQQGLDDFEKGEFSSLEDFVAEQNLKYGLSLES